MSTTGNDWLIQLFSVTVGVTVNAFPALSLCVITTLFALAKPFVSLAVPLRVNMAFSFPLKFSDTFTSGALKSTSNSTVFQSDLFPALSSALMCRYFLPSLPSSKSWVKFQLPLEAKIVVPLVSGVELSLILYSTCFTPVADSPVSCVFPWNL